MDPRHPPVSLGLGGVERTDLVGAMVKPQGGGGSRLPLGFSWGLGGGVTGPSQWLD